MIQAASSIGFALVFIVVTASISSALGGVILLQRTRLRRLGPQAERAAAACALLGPPVLAAIVTVTILAHSLSAGAGDHCVHHTHHLHICLYHGGMWGSVSWAVITVALTAALFTARAAERIWSSRRSHAALRALVSTTRSAGAYGAIEILLAPASSAFCFVAGAKPTIFASTAAWEALDTIEREALLAHEAAHVHQGDLQSRRWLGMLALFALPGIGPALVAMWDEATERLCDRVAARASGTPTGIASALVKLARLGVPARMNLGASFMTPGDLQDRVRAVLEGGHESAAATWLSAALAASIVGTSVVAALWSDSLHHAIETILALV